MVFSIAKGEILKHLEARKRQTKPQTYRALKRDVVNWRVCFHHKRRVYHTKKIKVFKVKSQLKFEINTNSTTYGQIQNFFCLKMQSL
jgi:hypothetical protein